MIKELDKEIYTKDWEKDLEEVQQKFINQNVEEWTNDKDGFSYLSWAQAWKLFLKVNPTAQYRIIMAENRVPIFGSKKSGWMVWTEISVLGLERVMWLPVKDYKNSVILTPNMMEINTTIMRCLVKNMAMFGLGLTVYGGEDIPHGDENYESENTDEPKVQKEATVTNEQWETIHELGLECAYTKAGILKELEAISWNKILLSDGLEFIKKCKEKLKEKE